MAIYKTTTETTRGTLCQYFESLTALDDFERAATQAGYRVRIENPFGTVSYRGERGALAAAADLTAFGKPATTD